jgi:monoamine oxidase
MSGNEQFFDVAIVGAGLAGLSAAQKLTENGAQVCVIEARNRLAGRTYHGDVILMNGQKADLDWGGQWVGPSQTEMMTLLNKYNIRTIPTPEIGRGLFICNGQRADDIGKLGGVQAAFDKIDELAQTIDPSAPWKHPQATMLDNQNFETWIEKNVASGAREFIDTAIAGAFLACAAKDTTILDVADYVRNGGGIKALTDCEGGAQEACIAGGPPALAEAMSKELLANGCVIRLNDPVKQVEQTRKNVRLQTAKAGYAAAKLIITAPPVVTLDKISFVPALQSSKQAALAAVRPGYAMKVQAFYATPWWNKKGLSGVTMVDNTHTETFDISKRGHHILASFIYGPQAQKLRKLPVAAQHKWVINNLTELLGEEAQSHLGVFSHDWTLDPWTLGCFAGHFGLGGWTQHGADLIKPTGPIHWAGTESATTWRGYMEGAVLSGRRAASEIIAAQR